MHIADTICTFLFVILVRLRCGSSAANRLTLFTTRAQPAVSTAVLTPPSS